MTRPLIYASSLQTELLCPSYSLVDGYTSAHQGCSLLETHGRGERGGGSSVDKAVLGEPTVKGKPDETVP